MSDKRKQSFLYKTQHSVSVVREEQTHDLILNPSFHAFCKDGLAPWPPFEGDQEKERAALSDSG